MNVTRIAGAFGIASTSTGFRVLAFDEDRAIWGALIPDETYAEWGDAVKACVAHDERCKAILAAESAGGYVEQPAPGETDPRATPMAPHAPEDAKLGALLTALSAIENLDLNAWERCNHDSDAYREMTGAPSLAEAASALRAALA